MRKLTLKNTKGSLAFASIHAVYNCRDDQDAKALVWPDDGRFTSPDTFIAIKPDKPLLLDGWTASAIIAVYEAANVENKNKLARMIKKDRSGLIRVAEFAMRHVR